LKTRVGDAGEED